MKLFCLSLLLLALSASALRTMENGLPADVAKCLKSTTVKEVSGTFCNDGTQCKPGHYANDEVSCIFIKPKELGTDHYVTVHFQSMDVEEGYDFARVYDIGHPDKDHDDHGFEVIGQYAEVGGEPYESPYGLLVVFTSDHSNSDEGFTAQYAIHGNSGNNEPTLEEEVSFNLYKEQNAKRHKTTKYRGGLLYVRHAWAAIVAINPKNLHATGFRFTPVESKQRSYVVNVGSSNQYVSVSARDDKNRYAIMFSHEAPIGHYKLTVVTAGGEVGDGAVNLAVLYNPYVADSPVYMATDSWQDEYVESDAGRQYTGSASNWGWRPWNYDQYNPAVLKAVVKMLAPMSVADRTNPIMVARKLSVFINSELLWGRWDGKYDDGAAPWSWTGSGDIYSQFIKTGKIVKYGQCWVFAGVFTSALRAIGIGARPVSNFDSAHEAKPFDQIIDNYYVRTGADYKKDGSMTHDSIWNFHVWTEAWMARSDIGSDFGGWQAVDSTAQETSGNTNLYQTGPASLKAMKAGKTDLNYDNAFVMGETNADLRTFVKQAGEPDSAYKLLRTDHHHVGKLALTKARDSVSAVDVKGLYKDEAPRFRSYSNNLFLQLTGDVSFSHTLPTRFMVGDTFATTLKADSSFKGKGGRTIIASCSIYSVSQDGKTEFGKIGSVTKELDGSGVVELTVTKEDYQQFVGRSLDMRVQWQATVKETGQLFIEDDGVSFETPPIEFFTKLVTTEVGHARDIKISFTNPLSIDITEARFAGAVGSAGFDLSLVEEVSVIAAGETKVITFTGVKTPSAQKTQFVVSFYSKELVDVSGSVPMTVTAGVFTNPVRKNTLESRGLTALVEKFKALNKTLAKVGTWLKDMKNKAVKKIKDTWNSWFGDKKGVEKKEAEKKEVEKTEEEMKKETATAQTNKSSWKFWKF